jgi:serine/threonine protein phosphatase PrpC
LSSNSAGFKLRAGHATALGKKSVNEDSFAVRVPEGGLQDTKGAVAVIADGLSGSNSGREAAQLVVHGFLSDYFSTPETWAVNTSVSTVLAALNGWLFRAQSGREAAKATTLTILILKSHTAHIFHVGDSRILRLRDGQPTVLTQAHRVVMPGGEAYLSRAVGIEPLLQVDYRREPLELGDYFVLSTDGVHDVLSDTALLELLDRHADAPQAAADAIVAAALAAHTDDNASCVTLKVDGLPSQDLNEFYSNLTHLPFPPDLAAGMIIDGYRVIEELHASSRSQIYLVEDEASKERLALKAPSVNFEDDPRYIHLFITEEWIGLRLRDPRIVRILEPARPRSFLYTLMEPIRGTSLRQWMDAHPKPGVEQVQRLVGELAAALNALHRREVLHRDLKPQNVMLAEDGTVKIVDLGSVRVAALEEIVTPLDPNHLVGTVDYAAPEFYENQPGSERSDLYALATIVYEMLTGKLPYGGQLPKSTDSRRAHYVSALHHNPMVPVWVDGAVQKAVACAPDERYEAISEFVYDLTHPNPKFVYRVPRPLIERNPVAFWRGLAALLLALNLLTLYLLLK